MKRAKPNTDAGKESRKRPLGPRPLRSTRGFLSPFGTLPARLSPLFTREQEPHLGPGSAWQLSPEPRFCVLWPPRCLLTDTQPCLEGQAGTRDPTATSLPSPQMVTAPDSVYVCDRGRGTEERGEDRTRILEIWASA